MAPLTEGKQGEDLNKYLKSSQGKSYFVAAVTLLFIVVFIIFGILPAYGAVFDQIAANEERDDAIRAYESKIATLESFDLQAVNDANLISYFEDIFPLFEGVQDEVTNRIYTNANELNLVVMSTLVSEAEAGEQEIDLPLIDDRVQSGIFQTRLRGDREALLNFVERLEESRFIFDIRSSTLSKVPEDQLGIDESIEDGDHMLTMQIQYYYWDDSDQTISNTGN